MRALGLLLAAVMGKGLLNAGGKQHTGSAHVVAAVRELNQLELAGKSARGGMEALGQMTRCREEDPGEWLDETRGGDVFLTAEGDQLEMWCEDRREVFGAVAHHG